MSRMRGRLVELQGPAGIAEWGWKTVCLNLLNAFEQPRRRGRKTPKTLEGLAEPTRPAVRDSNRMDGFVAETRTSAAASSRSRSPLA